MGGTDDPSNIIELTVEEHANAHRDLYVMHGKYQDKIAWMTLSGQIGQDSAQRGLNEEWRKNMSRARLGKKLSKEHCKAISRGKKGRKFTDAHRKALSEAQKKSPNHTTRGKKRNFRKVGCPRCRRMISVSTIKQHSDACTR
jgi:hypothetical protein